MKRSKDAPNPASSGGGNVVLYDEAFSGRIPLQRLLCHELAHERYAILNNKERRTYWMATGWMDPSEFGLKGWIRRKDGFVRESGKVSPSEDFANNVEYFLFENGRLREVTPAAHAWIKDHFGDSFELGEAKSGAE